MGRWQAGEVEGEAAGEGVGCGGFGGGEVSGGELLLDEVVDGVGAGRDGLFGGADEGPVVAPGSASGDPLLECGDLLWGEWFFVGVLRRHEVVGIGGGDAMDEFAFVGGAGFDDGEGTFAGVEAEICLAGVGVEAVAGEAVVGE